ncbi:MAG: ABC transporter permease [Clostridiales bacterium]|jgi:putative ABC transport system permease protein|nr:ABC transporter permease [Clostridiales bacterium]
MKLEITVANKRTVNALALRQIRAGKARNLFAVAAVALTSALVTAVLAMGAGLMDANRYMMMRSSGQKSEVSFEYLTAGEASAVAAHPLIKEYGLSRFVARAEGGAWDQTPIEIKTMDAAFADFSFSAPTTGKLPEGENEVAVKSWMLDKLGLPREIGQAFPLSFAIGGARHELELAVCGIWDDDIHLHPYGAALISAGLADRLLAGTDPGATRTNGEYNGITQLYANLDGPQFNLRRNLGKIVAETGISADLATPRLSYAYESMALDAQSLAAAALMLLIVLASGCLLIYNIFYISVARDIRHYGLLKTIGATKPQIRRIVNVQALAFCAAGIPLGLLLGYFLAAVLFPLLLGVTALEGGIALSPGPPAFAAAALLSLATAFASCSHPARIAGKISPVDATRYAGASAADAAAAQKKTAKRGRGGARIGRMAFANLLRTRKKTLIALASVSFGLILFNVVFTFMSGFDENKALEMHMHGDFLVADGSYLKMAGFYYSPAHTLSEGTVGAIAALDGVSDVARVYYQYRNQAPPEGKGVETLVPAQIYGMDDYWLGRLEASVVAGAFDREKFLSGKCAVIGWDPQGLFAVGDTAALSFGGRTGAEQGGGARAAEAQYEVMAIADPSRLFALSARFSTSPGFSVYLPASELAGRGGTDIMSATVLAESGRLAALRGEIGALLAGRPGLDFRSRSDYVAELESSTRQLAVVGVALCLVVLLIGALNFVNASITGIMSRRREFAMLQAIGMTAGQCRAMLALEGAYFALAAAAILASAGFAASFAIVRPLAESTAAYTYRFTALPLLICLPPLLLTALVLPQLAYRGVSRASVVERLREYER